MWTRIKNRLEAKHSRTSAIGRRRSTTQTTRSNFSFYGYGLVGLIRDETTNFRQS